jgi:hypothetical protein
MAREIASQPISNIYVGSSEVSIPEPTGVNQSQIEQGIIDSVRGSTNNPQIAIDEFSFPENEYSGLIFREGATNPGNLTPRAIDNGELSFRDSLSNPWPRPAGKSPVFEPGEPYFGVDPSELPSGSVIYDNTPPGHVGVHNVPWSTIKEAWMRSGSIKGKLSK